MFPILRRLLNVVALAMCLPALAAAQPGVYLPGAGAVNAGMAGVSTATPIDAIGALYWNPAAIGRLGRNEVSIGGALVYPDISYETSRPRLDGTIASGRTRSDNGFPLIPSIGVVSKLDEDSRWTFGTGLLTLGGGGVNFPGDPNNPGLSATGPFGQFVLGSIFSSMQLMQVNPTASYQVTDRLVIGFGPTIDITMVSFNPAFFAQPNRIADAPNTFPAATNSRPYWGGGFRAGFVYSVTDTLDVGFGYTSPQWLETWRFNAVTNLGQPQTLSLQASLPAIYSWGAAWRASERLLVGLDLRFFDYENADMFGPPVREGGLGWKSTFVTAIGANYQLTDRVAVRAGYQYNTNPLENTSTLFNVQAPAIIQNTVSLGTTVSLTDAMSMSLGYAYGFRNSVTGSEIQAPNTRATLEAASHSLLFNLQVRFGGPKTRETVACMPNQPCPEPAPTPIPSAK